MCRIKSERNFLMLVAICDDESIFRNELKSILVNYKKERRINLDIFEFSDGDSLLESEYKFDIVFLDYQMPNVDGKETARILRSKNNVCSIIFITSFPEFMIDTYGINPYGFFIKPLDSDKLIASLDAFIITQKKLSPIIINSEGEQKIISSKDIVYIEGDGKYCYIRTLESVLHSSKTVSAVFETLPQHCFYRIHKSYVINMYCISSISGNTVILTNGEKALISRNYIADFKKAYKDFVKNFYLRL